MQHIYKLQEKNMYIIHSYYSRVINFISTLKTSIFNDGPSDEVKQQVTKIINIKY